MNTKEKRRYWIPIDDRRAGRYGALGLKMEEEVTDFLKNARNKNNEPLFEDVVHHLQNSPEDHEGRDITVSCKVGGNIISRSFGVTISNKRWNKTKGIHEGVPVFYTPIGYNPKNLLEKVLALFE